MIHVRESSAVRRPALARLHRATKTLGAIFRNSVKTRPGLWFGFAALGVSGVAWVIMKSVFASGSGVVLALLRDAGHQVGGGGLLGALGGALAGALSNYEYLPFNVANRAWRWVSDPPQGLYAPVPYPNSWSEWWAQSVFNAKNDMIIRDPDRPGFPSAGWYPAAATGDSGASTWQDAYDAPKVRAEIAAEKVASNARGETP